MTIGDIDRVITKKCKWSFNDIAFHGMWRHVIYLITQFVSTINNVANILSIEIEMI